MNRNWLVGLALWLTVGAVAADDLAAQRERFVAAETALADGRSDDFAQLAEGLHDYPLYPYLRYDELTRNLDQARPGEVRTLLKQLRATPLDWQLRRRWLQQLAKREQWSDFLKDYRPTSDITLQCQQLRALIATGQADKALPKTEALWLHGASRPDACDTAFARWQQAGNPSKALAWKRINLAMRAGNLQLVNYLRRYLPGTDQPWVDHWIALYRNPDKVATFQAPGRNHPYLRRMQAHAIERWARQDPIAALQQWQTWQGNHAFGASDQRRVTWRLAVNLFNEPQPEARQFFIDLKPGAGDTRMQELKLRAALSRLDWQDYLDQLAQLPPAVRNTARARYWQARALGELGHDEAARPIYQRLAGDRGYHGFLAADRLDVPYHLLHNDAPASDAVLAELAAIPALRRSHELYVLSRYTDARREWRLGNAGLSQERLVGAAKLAESWGWHDQAIITIAQGRYWDDLELRFPLAYRDTVEQQAQRQELDPAWVYAVMRQESAFMHDVRSRVGATGLMQLMPATARKVARRLPEQIRVSSNALRKPDLNITLGSAYLREVLDGLYDNRVLATAAYNAGPHRVQRWLPERPMAADLWVELVPYGETRKYLKRVLSYTAIYQARLGQRPPTRLSDYMPPIQPAENYARNLAAKAGAS